jgi:DNA-binding transcriptional LysR family regulator
LNASTLRIFPQAAHGMGVAMGLFPISTAWVRDGRLAVPLPLHIPGLAYYLVYRPEDRGRPELLALRD